MAGPSAGTLGFPELVEAATGPPRATGEFWTARQRQGHSLHEISYRACFKPQLPAFFIKNFTQPGDLVADPFLGRGTAPLQAYLMGRRAAGSDANPLCVMLARPRFHPPPLPEAESRLREVLADAPAGEAGPLGEDLLAFYHPDTLSQLLVLRRWFLGRERRGELDSIDDWLRMVCLNRLSGHSFGFFSVRTMPPNQAVSAASQRQINQRQNQEPEPKDVAEIVMRKSRSLLRSGYPPSQQLLFGEVPAPPRLRTASADDLFYLDDGEVDLVVTSPPFLNIVDYRKDNWLRCWFAGVEADRAPISDFASVGEWRGFVRGALREMCRTVRDGGHIAFEVGEVRNGEVLLEEEVLRAADGLPLAPRAVLINRQRFTKTSHLWGVDNNNGGTNTNRVVFFQRAG